MCTKPMPSMPLYFWGDEGHKRYLESYFDMFPASGAMATGSAWSAPGIGATGAVIYGRSDATINRHGMRMGTAELYRAVEVQPEVLDSLVVDLEYLGRESWMPLFVVLREGLVLDDALVQRLKQAIRQALSARHVPNDIFQVAAIPRTLSGKKMELPVKKLLMGAAPEAVLNRDAMANAGCIDWFVDFAPGAQQAPPDPERPSAAGQRRRSQPRRHRARLALRLAPAVQPHQRRECCGCRSAPTGRGLSSLLTLTSSARPASCRPACSKAGAIMRQGPHHGAQKSTSTGSRVAPTTASKLASVSSSGWPCSKSLPQRPQAGASSMRAAGRRLVAPQCGQATCRVSAFMS